MQDIGVIKNADVVINNDIIEFAGTSELNTNSDYDVIIDCSNKTVVPGLLIHILILSFLVKDLVS